MIKIYPYEQLGHVDHGWLSARHHFSFASYQNPNRLDFGALCVINDDIIKAQSGFAPHSHQNMEIITYIRSGAITHKDSNGNEGRTDAGNIQVMSAGTGIKHSEYNLENEDTSLYQIWIKPNKINVSPRWDTKIFPQEIVSDKLPLLVSGENDATAPLFIYQDAQIYAGHIQEGCHISHPIKNQAYILVSDGCISLNGEIAKKGDGVEATDSPAIEIKAMVQSEILVIDVPS